MSLNRKKETGKHVARCWIEGKTPDTNAGHRSLYIHSHLDGVRGESIGRRCETTRPPVGEESPHSSLCFSSRTAWSSRQAGLMGGAAGIAKGASDRQPRESQALHRHRIYQHHPPRPVKDSILFSTALSLGRTASLLHPRSATCGCKRMDAVRAQSAAIQPECEVCAGNRTAQVTMYSSSLGRDDVDRHSCMGLHAVDAWQYMALLARIRSRVVRRAGRAGHRAREARHAPGTETAKLLPSWGLTAGLRARWRRLWLWLMLGAAAGRYVSSHSARIATGAGRTSRNRTHESEETGAGNGDNGYPCPCTEAACNQRLIKEEGGGIESARKPQQSIASRPVVSAISMLSSGSRSG